MKRSIVSAVSLLLLSSLVAAHAVAQDQTEAPATEPAPAEPETPEAPTPPAPPPPPTPPVVAAPAAKAAAKPAAKEKAEVISVTGSRLKRTDVEGPAPVQIIDKEQIEKSGFNTVADVIRELPVNSFGAVREEAGRGAAGSSSVNLRGVGEEYTLVLIDGRRLPADPILESVDIGEIPVAMIERIEILKEGASALYGSDAVGGVVNIITKKTKEGTSVLYSRTFTAEKGGNEQRIEVVSGASNERTSVVVAASYRDRTIVMDRDRSYTDTGWSNSGNPGSFSPIVRTVDADGNESWGRAAGVFIQPDPNCPTNNLSRPSANTSGNRYCQFNYAQTSSSSPSVNQLGVMAKFDHKLTEDINLFGFVKDSRRSSRWNFAPAPQTVDVTDPAAVAAIKASLGTAGDGIGTTPDDGVQIIYRTLELGTRNTLVEEKNTYGATGLNGNINGWDWEYSFSKGRTWRNDTGIGGYWLVNRFQEAIASGAYNPFDPNRDTSALATSLHKPWSVESSELLSHSVVVSGSVGSLAGGDIGLAVGVSKVEESYRIIADDQTINDEVAGSSSSLGGGARDFRSVFAEVGLPITKEFEVDLAARFDEYSDVGDTTNPRLALKYKLPSVLLRGSVGTGFRAPSLQTINDDGGAGFPSFVDAVGCKNAQDSGEQASIDVYCGQQQYYVETIAAKDLKPEKTLFWSTGVVFEPGTFYNLGVDYWMLQIKDKIGIPDYYLLTKAEAAGQRGFEKAGVSIERDANGGYVQITTPAANLSKVETAGIDLNSNLTLGNRASVQYGWSLDTAYTLYYKESAFEGQSAIDRIGTVGKPQWKVNNAFTAAFLNDHVVGLSTRIISSTEKSNPTKGDIPIHTEWDMQYTFNRFYNGSIAVGAVNILNRKPPTDETQVPVVDLAIYSNMGQSAYVKLTQDF